MIRTQDIPERMQLETSTISDSMALSQFTEALDEEAVGAAAEWITPRISPQKAEEYQNATGSKDDLVAAVAEAVRFLFINHFEVPYIWAYKRDFISHMPGEGRYSRRPEYVTQEDLWRIYSLGRKYMSLIKRREKLGEMYKRLEVEDEYFTEHIQNSLDNVDTIADTTRWLAMRYGDKKKDVGFGISFHDDEEDPEAKKMKKPSRTSAYDVHHNSVVSKLAAVSFILRMFSVS